MSVKDAVAAHVERTIHERMADAMSSIQSVSKSDRNESQNFSFRGIDAVLNTVGPVLREHRIIVLPIADPPILSTYQTRNGATMTHAVLPVTIRFCGPAGDEVECRVIGEAADAGDKVLSKAHSVALRIALLQVFAIPTDEPDPDSQSHERAAAPVAKTADDWAVERGFTDASEQSERFTSLAAESKALPDDPRADLAAWVKAKEIKGQTLTADLALQWSNRVDEAKASDPEGEPS